MDTFEYISESTWLVGLAIPFGNYEIFFQGSPFKKPSKHVLKGQGHVAVNKPVSSKMYIVAHTYIVFCADFGGWGESTRKLRPKIHQYLCNRTTYECSLIWL